jgi:hypothetical protein
MNDNDIELSLAVIVKRLGELLVAPAPISDEQKEQASKRAGLLFTAMQKEDVTSVEWLMGLSLLARAKKLGIPGSKNRVLPVARLFEIAPCALHRLPDLIDQSFCIEAISRVRSSWCEAYIFDYIRHENSSALAVPDLLRWLRRINDEPVQFLIACLDLIAGVKKPEIRGVVIKFLAKQAAQLVAKDKVRTIDAISHFPHTISQLLSEENHEANLATSLFEVLMAYIDSSRLRFPLLVLDIDFLRLIRLTTERLSPSLVKVWMQFLRALGASAASCLSEILRISNDNVEDHARAMIPIILSAYPEFTDYAKTTPRLATLLEVRCSASEELSDDAIVHAFGRLLPAWDDFLFTQQDRAMLIELDNLLKDAAGAVNIVYLGERNQLISYDPLHHSLVDNENSAPMQVKVLRPGAAMKRPDGSLRVILPAQVAVENN